MTIKKTVAPILLAGLLAPALLFAESETSVMTDGGPSKTAMPPRPLKEMRGDMRKDIQETRTEMKDTMQAKRGEMRENASSTRQDMFCSELDKVLSGLDTRGIKLEDNRMQMQQNGAERRDEHRSDVDTRRDENLTKRNEQLAELGTRAKTDAQKQAIAAFVATMDAALKTRDAAVDAILATHRAAVDAAVASRKTAVDAAIATLKTEVEAAKTKAKADCGTGVAPQTIRTTLRAAVLAAQEKFKTTVQGIEKVKDVSSTERDARKAELDAVYATFKTTAEKAGSDLKAALKAARTTPTPAPTTTQ